ncbi:hypothetical protein MAIT1_04167 [Magnetofaba australis IT-1]|uniref:GYF domain-containing protein n=1 Tax=Magnetofaba australis IT-1 TaxID=1434232 RepID=A0A1Y2K5M7_9PROT|nr:hypothetical protein MAIT1_04167 [Magnetofaba australis IT-1]
MIQGAQQGPYNLDGVRQWVASGQVNGDTLAWMPGLPQWTPASQIPALATLFSAPPPLPPSAGGPPPLPNG